MCPYACFDGSWKKEQDVHTWFPDGYRGLRSSGRGQQSNGLRPKCNLGSVLEYVYSIYTSDELSGLDFLISFLRRKTEDDTSDILYITDHRLASREQRAALCAKDGTLSVSVADGDNASSGVSSFVSAARRSLRIDRHYLVTIGNFIPNANVAPAQLFDFSELTSSQLQHAEKKRRMI
ncbi:hypothetical protein BC827DRAFT_948712 [Russula dissimulans]|nr:hypothetical protein BC827DRAFT_948712 [Russula dissimulans]